MSQVSRLWCLCLGLIMVSVLAGCNKPEPGHVEDEARRAGRPASSFPAADEDYYHDMDGGIALSADEIKGRNMWLVWTGGNDRLWDEMTVKSVGTFSSRFGTGRPAICSVASAATGRGTNSRAALAFRGDTGRSAWIKPDRYGAGTGLLRAQEARRGTGDDPQARSGTTACICGVDCLTTRYLAAGHIRRMPHRVYQCRRCQPADPSEGT